jgi:hypothetical protein
MNPFAEAESALVVSLAAAWLRGEALQVLASAGALDRERYKVRGLDEDGHPTRAAERGANAVLDAWVDAAGAGAYVAVRGDSPTCAAVGLYGAVRYDHAWFVVTSARVAVLRLRDRAAGQEGATQELLSEAKGSVGGALRGLGKFVKASATELARSMRRPPLHERPADAELLCEFEAPRQALAAVERWKQPLIPQLSGGPRHVQVHFTDGSWARLQTNEAGQAALTGTAD